MLTQKLNSTIDATTKCNKTVSRLHTVQLHHPKGKEAAKGTAGREVPALHGTPCNSIAWENPWQSQTPERLGDKKNLYLHLTFQSPNT